MLRHVLSEGWSLLRATAGRWSEDDASSMGAALAYYTLFSIAPLLLIVIHVAGFVLDASLARDEIIAQVSGLVGEQAARTIDTALQALEGSTHGWVASASGAFAMLVGATTVLAELQDSMDRIWRAPPRPAGGGLWAILRARLLSLGLVLGLGFLLIVSLVVSAGLALIGKWGGSWIGADAVLMARAFDLAVSYLFMTMLFAMIYRWLPRVRIAWRDVWIGAALTALLFALGKDLIGMYIGRSGAESMFGAAASLAVLMLWVYYSAQIFLFGAEFTSVFAHRHGSLRQRAAVDGSARDRPG